MANNLTATLRTNHGTVVIRLFPDQAIGPRSEADRLILPSMFVVVGE